MAAAEETLALVSLPLSLPQVGDVERLVRARGAMFIVTTRQGGVSAGAYGTLNLGLHVGDAPASVLENRRRVARALGAPPSDFVFCEQTHGREVTVVSAADRGRGTLRREDAIAHTDALVTRDEGTVLVVMVADCVPIVLHGPVALFEAVMAAGESRKQSIDEAAAVIVEAANALVWAALQARGERSER